MIKHVTALKDADSRVSIFLAYLNEVIKMIILCSRISVTHKFDKNAKNYPNSDILDLQIYGIFLISNIYFL